MKILKRKIYADTRTAVNSGTIFYAITMEQVLDVFQNAEANVWILKAFEELGWDAIDLDNNLFGSDIIDDTLYLCTTNGADIEVNGEDVNPEEALSEFTPEELQAYIQPATAKVIQKYITEYEIQTPDFDAWAVDLLQDGNSFSRLVQDSEAFE